MNEFPRLLAILDVDAAARAGRPPLDLARAYLDGGASHIQVRAKHLPSGQFLDLCDAVVQLARNVATVIVNDRADLARMAGASGVHLGQTDLPPLGARRVLGARAVVGLSTHNLPQVEAALREPVDYIAVGPVFRTSTKDTGYDAVGLTLVSAAARMAGPKPVVAIGGITLQTVPSVIEAGAASVAVITDLLATGDAVGRTTEYLRVLAQHRV